MTVDQSSAYATYVAEAVFYMVKYPSLFSGLPADRTWYEHHDASALRSMNTEIRTYLRSEGSLAIKPLFSITRTGIVVVRSFGRTITKELQ